MNTINLVVMGKTGAGKSTLINAVLEEDLAPTGVGQPITRQNTIYTKKMHLPLEKDAFSDGRYSLVAKTLNLYDTVGLEQHHKLKEICLQNRQISSCMVNYRPGSQ